MPYNFSHKRAAKRFYRAGKFAYKHRGTAVKALKMAQAIKRQINTEQKIYEQNNAPTVDTTGAVINILQPAQGDTYQTRDGVSIKPLHLRIRGTVQPDVSSPATYLRVVIVRGKQENGTAPTLTDIFTVVTIDAQQNWLLRNKNRILWDQTFHTSATEGKNFVFNKYIRLEGHTTFVTDGTSIENGGLYLMYFSNRASTLLPTLDYHSRVQFTDN